MSPAAVIVELAALPPVGCPCGLSRRAFAAAGGACTLHLVEIAAAARVHHHRRLTEVYYVLAGTGEVELDGVRHGVGPGMAVLIPPGVRHRLLSGGRPLTILNFVTPAFDAADEHLEQP